MARTLRQRLIAALEARKAEKVKETNATITYRLDAYPDVFIYVGRSNSLRMGKTLKDSFPANRLKDTLLKEQPDT